MEINFLKLLIIFEFNVPMLLWQEYEDHIYRKVNAFNIALAEYLWNKMHPFYVIKFAI